jgi:O-antigen/teichoic acid export membrane protein
MAKESNNTIQTFWIMMGSLASFGFTIVSSMILSRYFDKESYGTFKQVIYVYNSLTIAFTLGIPKAYSYFLPRHDNEEAKSVINKLNLILFLNGIFFGIVIYSFAGIISRMLGNEDLESLLKIFSIVPILMLPTMGLDGILSTYRKTKFLAMYNILSKLLMLLCVVLPVILFGGNVKDAIIGFVFASFISFIVAIYFKNLPLKNYVRKSTQLSYRKIFAYTLPIMGASIWGVLISSADQFFISKYFGNKVFAEFSNGSIELPFISMIISASSVVLYPIFSKKVFENKDNSTSDIMGIWHSVFKKSAMLVYPVLIFFLCFSDLIVVILYGEDYAASSIYFQIKLIGGFFNLIAYGPLMLTIGGEKYYFRVHMVSAILIIMLDFLCVTFFDNPVLISVISCASQIGRIFAILLFISKYFKIALKDLFPLKLMFDLAIPALIFLSLTKYFIGLLNLNNYILIISCSFLYVGFFYLWAKFRNIDYLSIIRPLMKKNRI